MGLAIALVGALVVVGALWVVLNRPDPGTTLTQADALNRLSEGFTWSYERPLVVFDLKDGTRLVVDHHDAASWYIQTD
jgi:hypothetical protein